MRPASKSPEAPFTREEEHLQKMRRNHVQSAMATLFFIFVLQVAVTGCGNPEAPQILGFLAEYWDLNSSTGWSSMTACGDDSSLLCAPASPVRVQGNITDNTAVVWPTLGLIGGRRDVQANFAEGACRLGSTSLDVCLGFPSFCEPQQMDYYECDLSCELVPGQTYYDCTPAIDARDLVRGDRITFKVTADSGYTFEWRIKVRETADRGCVGLSCDPTQEYRSLILEDVSAFSDGFVRSLMYSKDASTWEAFRSGDSVNAGNLGNEDSVQFRVDIPSGVVVSGEGVQASWKSLVKWNNLSYLYLDPKTGFYSQEFHLFDPRDQAPDDPVEETQDVNQAPIYWSVVAARDAADQKTDEYRSSSEAIRFRFSPAEPVAGPTIELDGINQEGTIETQSTSIASYLLTGTVASTAGEVRSLRFVLSGTEPATVAGSRILFYQPSGLPQLLSLNEGRFAVTIQLESDWGETGIFDSSIVSNYLMVEAYDVRGNGTVVSLPIDFSPPEATDSPPTISLSETFPSVNSDLQVSLPEGEGFRVWGDAADDQGQPAVSYFICSCSDSCEDAIINNDRWPIVWPGVEGGADQDLDASGQFPEYPWNFISVDPQTYQTTSDDEIVAVFKAKEKKKEAGETARFSAVEVFMTPDQTDNEFDVAVSLPEPRGPAVAITAVNGIAGATLNGMDFDPVGGLTLDGIILARVSRVNRVLVMRDGAEIGGLTYDVNTGVFSGQFGMSTVIGEGDRICVGAVSVTRHATIKLLEFIEISGDRLLISLTDSSDATDCCMPAAGGGKQDCLDWAPDWVK